MATFLRHIRRVHTSLGLATGKNSVWVLAATRPKDTARTRMATTVTGPADAQLLADTVYMVLPTHFGFNAATAADNAFQKNMPDLTVAEIRKSAQDEFQALVTKLKSKKIHVYVEDCTKEAATDAVFPNNVLSFQNEDEKPRIVLYPMKTVNRRIERQPSVIEAWAQRLGAEVVDYTAFEQKGAFLEGTGSMVLDRVNRIVYSCKSQRTYPLVLEKFCKDFGYKPIVFESTLGSVDGGRQVIYHTNVMMSVGVGFAVVGLETIQSSEERQLLRETLESTGKEIVTISEAQIEEFAGNLLEVRNADGEKFLVCSTRAFNSLEPAQLAAIRKYCDDILHVPLDTIEKLGGGGARCMLCEVFPSPK